MASYPCALADFNFSAPARSLKGTFLLVAAVLDAGMAAWRTWNGIDQCHRGSGRLLFLVTARQLSFALPQTEIDG